MHDQHQTPSDFFGLGHLFFAPAYGVLFVLIVLSHFIPPASAQNHRGSWMWGASSHPFDASNVIGDLAKESKLLSYFGAWGIDRVYASVSNTPISDPTLSQLPFSQPTLWQTALSTA